MREGPDLVPLRVLPVADQIQKAVEPLLVRDVVDLVHAPHPRPGRRHAPVDRAVEHLEDGIGAGGSRDPFPAEAVQRRVEDPSTAPRVGRGARDDERDGHVDGLAGRTHLGLGVLEVLLDIVQDLRPFRHEVDEDRVREDQDHEGFEMLGPEKLGETLHHGDRDPRRGEEDEEPVAEEPGGEHPEHSVLRLEVHHSHRVPPPVEIAAPRPDPGETRGMPEPMYGVVTPIVQKEVN